MPKELDLKTITEKDLVAFEGLNPKHFCDVGFHDLKPNHCAHFVSHVLGVSQGRCCGLMVWKPKNPGVTMTCDTLFNYCTQRGPWERWAGTDNAVLIFVTKKTNYSSSANTMSDSRFKHVGIHHKGDVWNYHNTPDKVVRDSLKTFQHRFRSLSGYGKDCVFLYGYRVDI